MKIIKNCGYHIEREVRVDEYGDEIEHTIHYHIFQLKKLFGFVLYKSYVEERVRGYGGSYIDKKSFDSREDALYYVENSLLLNIPKNETIQESEPIESKLFLE